MAQPAMQPAMEDFEALLNESFEAPKTPRSKAPSSKATVIAIENGQAIIDIGFKWKAASNSKNSQPRAVRPRSQVGDVVEVFFDRVENARGEAVLSARQSQARRGLGSARESQ